MFDINYTHTSSSFGSNQKSFSFTGQPGMTVEEKIPPQCQQIIQLTYALSLDKPIFTLNDIIAYIDENYEGTFTNSKGGTERIVRYYSKLLQTVGIITDINSVDAE
jgi:hypothetical protein